MSAVSKPQGARPEKSIGSRVGAPSWAQTSIYICQLLGGKHLYWASASQSLTLFRLLLEQILLSSPLSQIKIGYPDFEEEVEDIPGYNAYQPIHLGLYSKGRQPSGVIKNVKLIRLELSPSLSSLSLVLDMRWSIEQIGDTAFFLPSLASRFNVIQIARQ